ncbi:conserved hypothetical protein [Microsporum canis CBS 113480]|uniref:Aminoglycoside phosphotransferase domain-containing protein n=1 Tax=Arthroderma otae (strain ATCC MYA-4605 / CBS 113480) TaxID=554155 RepID=C5FQI0_ARTOC|nr:conserved hypothetical protein [Microsporum canis CBS 113480]EEQ32133.1 conserved hypothetical protein [Microsporum canis CBS 113480]
MIFIYRHHLYTPRTTHPYICTSTILQAPASLTSPPASKNNPNPSYPIATRDHPTIPSQVLPSTEPATFLESSLFSRIGPGAKLPSPANVREQGVVQDPTSKDRAAWFHCEVWACSNRRLTYYTYPRSICWTHTINREPLGDIIFTNKNRPPDIPLCCSISRLDTNSSKELSEIPGPFRNSMPGDAEVVFTHGDLCLSNIMISEDSKIVRIIDYWEFCKAEYTAKVNSEWLDLYIPLSLNKPACLEAWEFYTTVSTRHIFWRFVHWEA